jgi:hypothetical protein
MGAPAGHEGIVSMLAEPVAAAEHVFQPRLPDGRRVHRGHSVLGWARLVANDSLECRNCHGFDYMDFTRQSPRAVQAHSTYLAKREKTCIDCHKGISHRLPRMADAK